MRGLVLTAQFERAFRRLVSRTKLAARMSRKAHDEDSRTYRNVLNPGWTGHHPETQAGSGVMDFERPVPSVLKYEEFDSKAAGLWPTSSRRYMDCGTGKKRESSWDESPIRHTSKSVSAVFAFLGWSRNRTVTVWRGICVRRCGHFSPGPPRPP